MAMRGEERREGYGQGRRKGPGEEHSQGRGGEHSQGRSQEWLRYKEQEWVCSTATRGCVGSESHRQEKAAGAKAPSFLGTVRHDTARVNSCPDTCGTMRHD